MKYKILSFSSSDQEALKLLKGRTEYCQFTVAVRGRGYLQNNVIIILGGWLKNQDDSSIGLLVGLDKDGLDRQGNDKWEKFKYRISNADATTFNGKTGHKCVDWSTKAKLFALFQGIGEYVGDISQAERLVSQYINAEHTDDPTCIKFTGIELVRPSERRGDRDERVLQKKMQWIFCLNAVSPMSLNEQLRFSCYL